MSSLQNETASLPASADPAGALGRLARVLTGDSRVSVTFGAGEPRVEGERFVLPAPLARDGASEAALLGALDLLAARHRYSEAARLDTPQAGMTGRIAQAIEDRRVLARLARAFPGARRYAQSWRTQRGEAVARRWPKLAWRERLAWAIERTLWDEAPGMLERDGAALAAALRAIDAELGAARASQSTRASLSAAAAIVAGVRSLASRGANNLMQAAGPAEGLDDDSARLAQAMDESVEDDGVEPPAGTAQPDDARDGDDGTSARARAASDSAAGAPLSEADVPHAATHHRPAPGRPHLSIPLTTDYDVVTDLTGRGDAAAWRRLRALARAETGALRIQLERLLKADELTHWKREQERGEIDRAALARLAASRGYRTPFRVARHASGRDTVVTLLLDLSGSMAGRKIELARLCAAALADALTQLAFDSEVLGYSSLEAPELRARYERARAAGVDLRAYNRFVERLDLRVFKRFDSRDLSGLAAIECGHENPDGEALAWAAARLARRKARRRLLFVLSDGYPSTSDGDPAVLRSDLLARVQAVKEQGIELAGIGILDDAVEAFYPDAVVVRKLHELPATAFATLSRLLAGRRH
ncbi:cobaltochelatase CobT-related protein [Paraburkholderia silvatlantica]|uniref:Cobalamin biosynthesis protein CobT n=1 Tax=Paraburkholderia silvatlantica TaxID=321895 RepID=A0A2V4UBA0_9BURK|nr:cobalamin biosynthesis protein CobT [Paraburkholderia silvatlantica]PYE21647.1 cobalamin biosynthesis protein CobT [Paraburkholderia silvatlantica]TDQ86770.1 cobalamin biosynthesis protein CobT [Paraburkholderia silvatlantica]